MSIPLRSKLLAISTVSAATLLISGCTSPSDGGAEGNHEYTDDGVFSLAVTQDLGSMNPYKERQNFGFGLAYFMYDSLVYVDTEGNVSSQLAEKWDVTPNSAEFTLKEGITCSDGTPLTASYVAEVLNFNADPANGSSQYGLRTSGIPGNAVGDDATRVITVTLESNDGLLLYEVGILPIVCPTGLKDPATLATASDGTGPYVLDSAAPGDRYTLKKREGYTWGPDGATTAEKGMPETVVLRFIPDPTTAANLLSTGELNLARVSGRDQARLDAQSMPFKLLPGAGAWLSFNQKEGRIVADKAVRDALVAAVDIDEVIKVSGGGDGTAPTSLTSIPPQVCAGDKELRDYLPKYDPKAAGKLLDSAGWTADSSGARFKDGQRLKIHMAFQGDQYALSRATAELLASKWEAVGIEVQAAAAEGPQMNQLLFKTSDYDIAVIGWSFGLPAGLVPYMSGPTPPDGTNVFYLDNKDYQKAVRKALSLTPPEACPFWHEADKALVTTTSVAPLSNRADRWYFNGADGDMQVYFTPNPMSLRVFK